MVWMTPTPPPWPCAVGNSTSSTLIPRFNKQRYGSPDLAPPPHSSPSSPSRLASLQPSPSDSISAPPLQCLSSQDLLCSKLISQRGVWPGGCVFWRRRLKLSAPRLGTAPTQKQSCCAERGRRRVNFHPPVKRGKQGQRRRERVTKKRSSVSDGGRGVEAGDETSPPGGEIVVSHCGESAI